MSTATAVRERPILFSGPMVRAILEGRKTVTRRVVTRRMRDEDGNWITARPFMNYTAGLIEQEYVCPYGQPGDHLWVRENLREGLWETAPVWDDYPGHAPRWLYQADGEPIELRRDDPNAAAMAAWVHHQDRTYCPSIHMPRWASRITLEVTGVRVERLQEITNEDAAAEGATPTDVEFDGIFGAWTKAFARSWDELNAARGYGWEADPWVWRIEFRRAA